MISSLNITDLCEDKVIHLAQSGNECATEQIINKYRPLVYKKASGFYMNGLDKEDIIQEGFIGLYQAILSYKPGKSTFKTFASICISRKIISVLKHSKRQKNIPDSMSVSLDGTSLDDTQIYLNIKKIDPEDIFISNENIAYYKKIISSSLTYFEEKVFHYQILGHSYKEIAKLLNKDVKSIDNAVQRIKRKLKIISSNA